MAHEELLETIGLTAWEARTYLALLELGSTTTGPLVKKCGVPQSKIYAVLESLIRKGLVNYVIKGKIKYFQAADPQRILTTFKEKEMAIEKILAALRTKQKKERQAVELYEELPAIRSMCVGILDRAKADEPFYGFSTGAYPEEANKFYHWWGARKHVAGIKDHLLISKQNQIRFEKSIEKEALSEVKKITRYSKISFPGDVGIFRDFVCLFTWEDPPTAIVVKSKNLSQQYKEFFLGLWNAAQPM
ncbi:TrmB family transcriptional regulator [Candidatus Woesearchaeota archaeon]|nr:TrmB family transcriptional regulator [Candidatus Woesearchaeota archaeon]